MTDSHPLYTNKQKHKQSTVHSGEVNAWAGMQRGLPGERPPAMPPHVVIRRMLHRARATPFRLNGAGAPCTCDPDPDTGAILTFLSLAFKPYYIRLPRINLARVFAIVGLS